jgi:hypothetical protein
MDLPPSIAPRSVPLTMVPPPKRAGRSAVVLILAAWVILGLVIVFRMELGDDFARPESWRSTLRRTALGVSAILALSSTVPAIRGLRRSPVLSGVSLLLALAWIGLMVWRVVG